MFVAVVLFVTVHTLTEVQAVTVSPCQESTVVISEKPPHTTVTCSGLSAQQAVNWRVTFPNLPQGQPVGSCPRVGSCTSSTEIGYTASRPSSYRSTLTIDPTVNASWVQNGTVVCQAFGNGTLQGADYCRLDVISVTVSPCQKNTVEISEKTPHTAVTCSGLSAHVSVNWLVTFPSLPQGQPVGSCPRIGSCTSSTALGYTASRPSADSSTLTIDPTVNVNWVQNGTIVCQAVENTIPRGSDDCQLDVVDPPDSVSCSVQPDTSRTPWTVCGQCDVTKVYSHLGRYRCQWYREEGTYPETEAGQVTMTTTPAEGKYVDGTCTVDMAWPFVDTTYRVVLTPGGSSRNVQTAGISKPSARLANCPADVREGQPLSCTCAGSAGEPASELKWSHLGSGQLTLSPAMRSHNGHKYQCLAVWNGRTMQTVNYTVSVAYGPDAVNIIPPAPLDTDGSRPLALTCSASESNPALAPSFTWTRLPSTEVSREQNYTFTPKPPADDGASFRCRAYNSRSGREPTDTVTITLNYPPTSGPAITSNSSDGNLYEGDTVAITCKVTGGNPVDATRVTLTCPGARTSQRRVNSTSVSSSVTYVSLSESDHGKQCTCSTGWKNTNWYRHTETKTISVISPPSVPMVSTPPDYPPIAGVTRNVILTCVSAHTGRSPTSYSWPVSRGGSPGQDGQGRGTLTFSTLRAEDNGQEVTCKASNLFTANRHEVLDGRLTLQVYCQPRPDREAGTAPNEPPTVNYVGTPVQETFSLEAYPVPTNVTYSYLGPSPSNRSEAGRSVRRSILHMDCRPAHLFYKVTCNVTVDNVTADDEGLYSARVANQFGHVDLEFLVTFNRSVANTRASKSPSIAAAIGGGVAAVILILGFVAVVVFLLIRRRRRGYSGRKDRERDPVYVISKLPPGPDTGPYENMDMAAAGTSSPYEVVDQYHVVHSGTPSDTGGGRHRARQSEEPGKTYETLVSSDVGLKSEYQTLGHVQNTGVKTPSNTYELLVMADVGLQPEYETVGKARNGHKGKKST